MKTLFLISLFGLFMIASTSGQSLNSLTLVAPAFASGSDDGETDSGESTHDEDTGSDNDASHDTESDDDEANNNDSEFHCPDGITTCYSSDGTEYTDVNNLPATAAGDDGSEGTLAKVVSPSHFRSF